MKEMVNKKSNWKRIFWKWKVTFDGEMGRMKIDFYLDNKLVLLDLFVVERFGHPDETGLFLNT